MARVPLVSVKVETKTEVEEEVTSIPLNWEVKEEETEKKTSQVDTEPDSLSSQSDSDVGLFRGLEDELLDLGATSGKD